MTEKELRRLSRADLLEMLIMQSKELRKAQKKLRAAETALENREIAINNAGSIAEASLQLNGIFEAAQESCEQYMENIRALSERQEAVCREREDMSVKKAETMLLEAKQHCAEMEEATRVKCDQMLEQAKTEADAYWDDVQKKLEAFCSQHAEVRDLLNGPRTTNR